MEKRPLYHWVDSSTTDGKLPTTAFQMGVDHHGHAIYVGRTHFDNELTPVHVVPGHKKAYVAYQGKEHPVEKYQLLCMNFFKWVPDHDGKVPEGAVEAGKNKDNSPLYVGRVFHEGSWIIGKIHPQFKVCCYPHDGKELTTKSYEALVCVV
ncbi:hypothetical protein Zmor_005306 [Zophobas morio]|uniref:Natterin-3 n=1 Tax=Zophobas morio TaxID=2755281 RepID=A0AA38MM92_9CUCU|nr:hypothetical protein Zmor_005306 [Zophobas morio]